MPRLDASVVLRLLREFGQHTALRPGNRHRAKACVRAADSLLTPTRPLHEVIAADQLLEIPEVGPAIAEIVEQMHATGTHPSLERMRRETPPGVLEMLTIPGLRPE